MQGMINPYSQALRSPQEDEMERQLRMLREASGQAGVTPQQIAAASQGAEGRYEDRLHSRANQDITGLEGDYKRQMAMADSLRGTAMPSGRTVGPSGIFVQNPYEQAAAGIKRLTGGYLGRQAEEGVGSTLKQSRLEKARAEAQLARREREEAQKQQRLENAIALRGADVEEGRLDATLKGLGIEERGLVQKETLSEQERALKRELAEREQAALAERAASNQATQIVTARMAQEAQDARAKMTDPTVKTAIGPDGDIGRYAFDETGAAYKGFISPETRIPDELQSQVVAYEAGQEGDLTPLQAQKFRDAALDRLEAGESALDDMGDSTELVEFIFNNDAFAKFGGKLDMPRLLSQFGIGEDAWEAQFTDQLIAATRLEPLAKFSQIFRPFSEMEVTLSLDTLPSLEKEPEAVVGWYATVGRQHLEKEANAAIRNVPGKDDRARLKAEKERVLADYDRFVMSGAAEADISDPKDLLRMGIDPKKFKQMLMDGEL